MQVISCCVGECSNTLPVNDGEEPVLAAAKYDWGTSINLSRHGELDFRCKAHWEEFITRMWRITATKG